MQIRIPKWLMKFFKEPEVVEESKEPVHPRETKPYSEVIENCPPEITGMEREMFQTLMDTMKSMKAEAENATTDKELEEAEIRWQRFVDYAEPIGNRIMEKNDKHTAYVKEWM